MQTPIIKTRTEGSANEFMQASIIKIKIKDSAKRIYADFDN